MSIRLVGIGEVLWDLLPQGRQLGGAPANFAAHAKALGADAVVVSRVGDDALGHEVMQRFQSARLPWETVQVDKNAPTGTVTVELGGEGVPHFTIHEGVAWDRLAVTPEAIRAVAEADAVCFGTLGQRTNQGRETVRQLIAATAPRALKVFDLNLRQHFYSAEVIERSLGMANVLKLNDDELPVLTRQFGVGGDTRAQLAALASRFVLETIALTRGAEGSLLLHGGCWSDHPAVSVEIQDTVGAGDAFTAVLTLGLLRGMKLEPLNALASEVAGFVCSRAGATPALPARFRRALGL